MMQLLEQSEELQTLTERLRPLYTQLASHPLYRSFETIEDLHVFMESHIFAVWDFMSLLKTLQRGLTCVDVPWIPSRYPVSRRLINEIVLGEESDVYGTLAISHFELYVQAMRECGACTLAIDEHIASLKNGLSWTAALARSSAPEAAQRFVRSTFTIIEEGKLHAIAAAFTFGREDLIPDMFRGFIRDMDQGHNTRLSGRLSTLRWYFDRHIEVDGDEHGPMALQMVSELCGNNATKWTEATEAAEKALHARLALWNAITARLQQTPIHLLVH